MKAKRIYEIQFNTSRITDLALEHLKQATGHWASSTNSQNKMTPSEDKWYMRYGKLPVYHHHPKQ